jgi:hypothetical protein
MSPSDFRFAFRIVGGCCEIRRLVDATAAFAAYAACDPKAEVTSEAYFSAFRFGADFAAHFKGTGSTADFVGPCWSPWLWWDLDSYELQYSHKDAGALAAFLAERYGIEPGALLLFFSGAKGFHVGLPTALWNPSPSADFHRTARRFAERLAELASVTCDSGVYDKVRAFRAPNSRHAKTGLHKRRLTFDELLGPLAIIVELAATPAPFDVPNVTGISEAAAADWQAAVDLVARESEAKAVRRAAGNGSGALNKATLAFIRDGAGTGDRHRLLFSAAANLAEFHCPLPLAVALLEESALDSGLPPKDVRRAIECGLLTVGTPTRCAGAPPSPLPQQDSPGPTQDVLDGSTVKEPPEAAIREAGGLAVESEPAPAELSSALARLWQSTPAPAPKADGGDAVPQLPPLGVESPPAATLPPGAVGSGPLEKPCRCGSREYADFPIGEGRTRRDCRKCGRFAGWGKWYDEGGPTP